MHHLGIGLIVVLAVLLLGPVLLPGVSASASGLIAALPALTLPRLAASGGVLLWLLLGVVVVGALKLAAGI